MNSTAKLWLTRVLKSAFFRPTVRGLSFLVKKEYRHFQITGTKGLFAMGDSQIHRRMARTEQPKFHRVNAESRLAMSEMWAWTLRTGSA